MVHQTILRATISFSRPQATMDDKHIHISTSISYVVSVYTFSPGGCSYTSVLVQGITLVVVWHQAQAFLLLLVVDRW